MAKKQMSWKTKGMNRDLSVSAFNPEFAFENRNLRLSTNDSNTLMSWVNEKGTKKVDITVKRYTNNAWQDSGTILGIVIGTAVLGDNLILFTHESTKTDHIYKLKFDGLSSMIGWELYSGNLNFDTSYPIETLVSYESENVQKVYWTDNRNQPRVINIAADNKAINSWKEKNDCFDFVRTLQLNEVVKVKKLLGASGAFPAGVLQYAFTYFDKYGQESNIFYTTPILYVSHRDRGGSPEDKVDNAFQITVNNVDQNFGYLRIYSILRTSINSTPICKRVQDINISDLSLNNGIKNATFIDAGNSGDSIDPTELLYKGGETVVCKTLEQKDNTLFLGNLSITRKQITGTLKTSVENIESSIREGSRYIIPTVVSTDIYPYSNQLTSEEATLNVSENKYLSSETCVPCGGFKTGDYYRLGVQFQYKTGKWSDPIWIGDKRINTTRPQETQETIVNRGTGTIISLPIFVGDIAGSVVSDLYTEGYRKVRPVCVFPGIQDRAVLCQGVINPTLYTPNHRYKGIDTVSSTASNEETSETAPRQSRRRRAPGTIQNPYPDAVGDLQAQSDWFFRSQNRNWLGKRVNSNGTVSPSITGYSNFNSIDSTVNDFTEDDYCLRYTDREIGITLDENNNVVDIGYQPYNFITGEETIRSVEIQGDFDPDNKFYIDYNFVTLHSPDIEFDAQMQNVDFLQCDCRQVGYSSFQKTLSDIDIQTETPPASPKGAGFVHKSFVEDGDYGIVSGLFYDDYIIDDISIDEGHFVPYYTKTLGSPFKWMVYLWNRSGSLNNDVARSAGEGVRTAVLKKKIISNLRYGKSVWDNNASFSFNGNIELFNSEENTIVKLKDNIYRGNVDTLLIPDNTDGMYFAFNYTLDQGGVNSQINNFNKDVNTPFNISKHWLKTFYKEETESGGVYFHRELLGYWQEDTTLESGDDVNELRVSKSGVRMKYKSTPHLILNGVNAQWAHNLDSTGQLNLLWTPVFPIVEVIRDVPPKKFGGDSQDALQSNIWIPCGEPVKLSYGTPANIKWEYGDSYYQRWDCLKTYPFTPEDENQVVEIGSFMLETRVNIDGRYDRNRGQSSNLYMRPQNFNLLNPVYSQVDNFFNYKIRDNSYYEQNTFPNEVTWSLSKVSGANVDLWTQMTLASILDLDGDKGELNKIIRFNDQLIAFQNTGISQIMFNENTAITTTEGVPIEIANSGKVQGKRYISNNIGCSNKWSITESPLGIYFIDDNDKNIFVFNGQLNNLSVSKGFGSWTKQNIINNSIEWNPETFQNFVSYYDKQNQDILFINKNIALAWSEKLDAFTSFYDYGGASYLCNLQDTGLWIKDFYDENSNVIRSKVWEHQMGTYCSFFGTQKDYGTILIGNPEPQTDKIFTNLEFRACVDRDYTKLVDVPNEDNEQIQQRMFDNFILPFDYLETWNEYQHGIANLQWKDSHGPMRHHINDTNKTAHLARKFRIWRCDIPMDNLESFSVFDATFDDTFHYPKQNRKRDRMRNPWLYIKLKKNAYNIEDAQHENPQTNERVEIHDFVMTYYN